MHVLFVRITGKISGTEVITINLLRVLSKSTRFTFTFLTNLEELSLRISKLGIRSRRIHVPIPEIGTKKEVIKALFLSPYLIYLYLNEIRKLERGKKFDLICLQSMTEKLVITIPLRLLNYKVIWHENGPVYISRMAMIIKYAYKFISIFVNKIIVISYNTQNDLLANGIQRNKVIVNQNGVDPLLFEPLTIFENQRVRKQLKIPIRVKVIGFFGTITFDKGVQDFISFSKYLLKNNPNYYFVMIGDGPALIWCKTQISNSGLNSKYIFAGYQPDVREYMGIFDYLYFPTLHHEGTSLTLLESLSMSQIVITRDIGATREIIKNGYNGFIYRNLSKHVVFKTISKINRNLELRMNIQKNARDTIIRDFNITNKARDLEKILLGI